MCLWRTTSALLVMFAPLGFSLTCLNTTNTADWSVSPTCWDTSITSPKTCRWDVVNAKTGQRVLTVFTLATDQPYFYCSETFGLPLSAGEYAYYISLPNSWILAFKLQIIDPGEPTLENCKSEVREGEKVMCLCSTQHEGNPPPVISWEGQGTSPVLLLQTARREHNKTYTCEMMWGNRTKTVFYDLYVRTDSPVSDRLTTTESTDEVEKDEDKNASSLPIGIIVAAAAAVLVLNVATTVIVIFIINRKSRRTSVTDHLTTKLENAQKQLHECEVSTLLEEISIEHQILCGCHSDTVNQLTRNEYLDCHCGKGTVLNKQRGNKKTGRRRSLPPLPYEDSIQGIIGDNVFISGITVEGTSPTGGS